MLALLPGLAAAAGPDKARCLSEHERGQALKNETKWRAARAAFAVCASETCPALVQKDCVRWGEELDSAQPGLLLAVRDSGGSDVAGLRVYLDGSEMTDRPSGTALEIDPGEHVLRFEAAGFVSHEQRVVVREGEKKRRLDVTLAPASAPVAPRPTALVETSSSRPAGAWLAAGLAVTAFGVGAGFGLAGLSIESDRMSQCAPRCTDDQLRSIRTDYAIADVSFGAGLVATVVAVWLFWPRAAAQATRSGLSGFRF